MHLVLLELYLGYFHIKLSSWDKQLYNIATLWREYGYQNYQLRFVISLMSSSKIYISKLFKGFDMVRSHIYYEMVITQSDFIDHIKDLEKFLRKIA